VHPGAVGFVFASFSLIVFLSSPAFGVHMARLGQRNTLFTGLTLLSCATVGFGFMERVGTGKVFFTYCVFMRVLQGLGSAATETASYAIAATLFPDNVTYMLGILEVANGLGYVIGPPVGGMLYNVSPMLPFLVVGLSPVPVLAALFHLLPRNLGDQAEPSDWAKLRSCLSRRGVILVCAAAVIGEGSFAFVEPVLEVFLAPLTAHSDFIRRVGGHHGGVGLIYAIVSVVYSAVVPAVGILSRRDRVGTRHVMVFGLASIATGFLLLAPSPLLSPLLRAPSLGGVALGMAFLGLGQSAALVPNMACLMEVCEDMPDSEATTNVLAGVLNASYSLGSMLAPIASSTLGVHLPFRWSTTMWSAAVAAMAVLLATAWEGDAGGGAGALMGGEGLAVAAGWWGVGLLRAAGAAATALGLDSAKAEKDGRAVPYRRRRTAQLLLLGFTAAALAWVYSGEIFMMRTLHAGGASSLIGTTDSDTEVYYELLEEAGIRTSSDEATIAAVALGEARASGEGLLAADEPLLGSDAAAAPAGGVTDAVAAAAVRMATRMALARLMMR
jgi:MFS family permease